MDERPSAHRAARGLRQYRSRGHSDGHGELQGMERCPVSGRTGVNSGGSVLGSHLTGHLCGEFRPDAHTSSRHCCTQVSQRNTRLSTIELFGHLKTDDERNLRCIDYRVGYALNVTSRIGPVDPRNFAAYGAELERKVQEYHGSSFHMTMMGEVLGRYENHVRINKGKVHACGIPVLHVETKYTENEYNMAKDAVEVGSAVAEAAGFEVLSKNMVPNPPGYSIHEVGTCRMRDDPKRSVLNRGCQSHDHKNLVVVDGARFTSAGWQNPTMTNLALSMRASTHLAGEMSKRNI